jgi:peptide/nickel transport system permease protein
MLDVLEQDYITAGRARGIRERILVYKHGLRNAFIPIVTLLGLQFALLLAGAILTETTFSWPGMGRLVVDRIFDRDFSTVQGSILFFALLVAGVNLFVDTLYGFLDPRIRY